MYVHTHTHTHVSFGAMCYMSRWTQWEACTTT